MPSLCIRRKSAGRCGTYISFDPWLVNLLGIALFLRVIGLNLVGDGLQGRQRT